MNWFSKIVVIVMIIICCFWVKETFFPNANFNFNMGEKIASIKPDDEGEVLEPNEEGKKILGDPQKQQQTENTAKIYFLKLSDDGTSKIYVSKRELKEISLTNAIKSLLKGPDSKERKEGVYSEIPDGTRLLSVMESDSKIIINLNSEFQYGGGTESINNRLRQLVKTVVNISPDKNLYLYIEGKEVDVLGGDGVMITQPLNISDFNF